METYEEIISEDNLVTLPSAVCSFLGVDPGGDIDFVIDGDEVFVRKSQSQSDLSAANESVKPEITDQPAESSGFDS